MAAVMKDDSGWLPPAVLSIAVHLLLFLVLVFGVSWQSRPPEAVIVELWDRPSEASVQPTVQPPPPPKLELKPELQLPKPAPRAEPAKKADIALEKEKKAPPKKPPPKEEPLDLKFDPKEQLNREMQQLEREREKREAIAQLKSAPPAAPAAAKVDPTYANRISARIKGNIILPPNIIGNPEAVFDVDQLPTGEVMSVKLRTPSGNKSYDEAVERAIFKSSPLPQPDRREQFQRRLELKFRPLDR